MGKNSKSKYCVIIISGKRVLYPFDKKDLVLSYNWWIEKSGYPISHIKSLIREKRTSLRLHTLIMGKRDGSCVDHMNGNKLDNRMENLRFVTQLQNCRNRISLGISFNKIQDSWEAYVNLNKKKKHIGWFKNRNHALKARKNAVRKYYGDDVFFNINKPMAGRSISSPIKN